MNDKVLQDDQTGFMTLGGRPLRWPNGDYVKAAELPEGITFGVDPRSMIIDPQTIQGVVLDSEAAEMLVKKMRPSTAVLEELGIEAYDASKAPSPQEVTEQAWKDADFLAQFLQQGAAEQAKGHEQQKEFEGPFLPGDRKRVEALALRFMTVMHDQYQGPITKQNNFEILNALAFCVAVSVLPAESYRQAALEWFDDALHMSLGDPELLEVVGRLDERMGGKDPTRSD